MAQAHHHQTAEKFRADAGLFHVLDDRGHHLDDFRVLVQLLQRAAEMKSRGELRFLDVAFFDHRAESFGGIGEAFRAALHVFQPAFEQFVMHQERTLRKAVGKGVDDFLRLRQPLGAFGIIRSLPGVIQRGFSGEVQAVFHELAFGPIVGDLQKAVPRGGVVLRAKGAIAPLVENVVRQRSRIAGFVGRLQNLRRLLGIRPAICRTRLSNRRRVDGLRFLHARPGRIA